MRNDQLQVEPERPGCLTKQSAPIIGTSRSLYCRPCLQPSYSWFGVSHFLQKHTIQQNPDIPLSHRHTWRPYHKYIVNHGRHKEP